LTLRQVDVPSSGPTPAQDWPLRHILATAERSLACTELSTFFGSLREQVEFLQSLLFGEDPSGARDALAAALDAARHRPRLRQTLELALVPLYDKPLLPRVDDPPEFLWLFAVPVCVTFAETTLAAGSFALPADLVDGAELIAALRDSGHVPSVVPLRAFSGLWQREDLTGAGAQTWALTFVGNELFEADAPTPRVVDVSEHFPLHRSREFFVLAAARVPVGTRRLFAPVARTQRFRQAVVQCVRAGLERAGVAAESVQAFAPGPLAQAWLLSAQSWQAALQANLRDAAAHGAREVLVRYPGPDYFEVVVRNAQGRELAVAPPALALEPKLEVVHTLADGARAARLAWSGSFSSAHLTSALLQ
jgi:hypothetical protein